MNEVILLLLFAVGVCAMLVQTVIVTLTVVTLEIQRLSEEGSRRRAAILERLERLRTE